jgi:hypothetical protein
MVKVYCSDCVYCEKEYTRRYRDSGTFDGGICLLYPPVPIREQIINGDHEYTRWSQPHVDKHGSCGQGRTE